MPLVSSFLANVSFLGFRSLRKQRGLCMMHCVLFATWSKTTVSFMAVVRARLRVHWPWQQRQTRYSVVHRAVHSYELHLWVGSFLHHGGGAHHCSA